MRNILCVAFIFFCLNPSFSQDRNGTLSGTLLDKLSSKPLSYATVGIYNSSDTALIAYKLTDENGKFKISQIPTATQLRMVITYTGYAIKRKEFIIKADLITFNLGNLFLEPSLKNIEEVIIHAERPPVMVRKDTIEFNASAFKTLPDALVEDLLRKLPGVNVDKNGNILVNGKQVTTIYVDGKDFFGGDVRIASKNLPANTIDRVEVTNDPEILRSNPLMSEAEIPQIINLKLKPGIKKGIFGKLYAGGGIQNKHEAGALINLFRDTTQISILGYTNDLNKAGFNFTDIRSIGGFGRSGWGNANGNGNGGLSIDNVSFGGFGSGLMNSYGGGGNFNTIIKNKVLFSLTYFYGGVTSDYDELKNNSQNFNGSQIDTRQVLNQTGNNNAHLIGSKIGFNINSKLKIEFKPQLVISDNQTNKLFNTDVQSNNNDPLSNSHNTQKAGTQNNMFYLWTKIMPTLDKKGRILDISNHTTIENQNLNIFNIVKNNFYNPPSTSAIDQLRSSDVKNMNSNSFINFTEPLSKALTLSTLLSSRYANNTNDLNTYFPDISEQYIIPVDYLSENFTREAAKTHAGATMRWRKNNLSLSPGITLSHFTSTSTFSKSPSVKQNFIFILPSFALAYKSLYINYNTDYREPALANLQALSDNTNPLFIREGNPNLKPQFSHNLNVGLRKFDVNKSFNYDANIYGNSIKNATIIRRTIDLNGVQISTPINAETTWSYGSNLSFQKDWKMDKNKISLIASNNLSYNQTYVLINTVKSDLLSVTIRPSAELRLNLNDVLEFNQSYSLSSSSSKYNSVLFNYQQLIYQDSKTEIIFRPTNRFVVESTLDYRYNSNVAPGIEKDYYKWNAGISFLFLKGNRGLLKLSVNDILDQNILASRIVRENYIEDMQGSTLRRHTLLTFTYNIRSFGGKIGGRNSIF